MAFNKAIRADLTLDEINNWLALSPVIRNDEEQNVICGTFQGRLYDPETGKATDPNKCYEQHKSHDKTLGYESTVGESCKGPAHTEDLYDDESLISNDMNQLDTDSVLPPLLESNMTEKTNEHVYSHYDFEHVYDPDLPTTKHRREIVRLIRGFSVSIIKGSTGSGKTTQVPQFILDDCARRGEYCNIVVTQPRKIAAMSIANRVSAERNWTVGQLVGYQVGLDKKITQDTRITYMTTGVLLCHLVKERHLTNYTHIILDEVHERDQETDFAMLVVRKLLKYNSQTVKVILMSATYNTTEFANYFSVSVEGQLEKARLFVIEGEQFTSEVCYTDHLTSIGPSPKMDANNPDISDEAYDLAANLIGNFDNIDRKAAVENPTSMGTQYVRGSVLVFLPGLAQIKEMAGYLEHNCEAMRFQIMPLHSSITLEEQQLVFSKPKPGYRKIVLSTNIAESSITIQDIKYVIDFCLTKCLVCDIDTNYQSLRLQWASKASLSQRAGRAGRVSDGHVYRMISVQFYESNIEEYAVPEMQRCSLESTILKVKLMDLGSPREILSLAFSPPNVHNIERTILLLKEIGALSAGSCHQRFDGNLTFVGKVLASLPLDMRLGKLMMLGFVFGCLNECIIIAAALSKSSFLACPYNKALEAFKKKLFWSQGSSSDCIALLNAYTQWEKLKKSYFFRKKKDEMEWGRKNFIQIRRINEVSCLVEELQKRLSHFNIRFHKSSSWEEEEKENLFILKIVMAGAFYPNYFLECDVNEEVRMKEMSFLNPKTTVMYAGLPSGKAFLYKDSIVQHTKCCGTQKNIYYDGARAFVEFQADKGMAEGTVLPAVYHACRLSDYNRKLTVYQCYEEVNDSKVWSGKYPTSLLYEPLSKNSHKYETPQPGSPNWYDMRVTYIGANLSIWGYKLIPDNLHLMHTIQCEIAACKPLKKPPLKHINVGMLVLAPSANKCGENQYYRALVVDSSPLKVWFVDYGNSSDSRIDLLRKIPNSIVDIPFQTIEFRPRGIRMAKTTIENAYLDFMSKAIRKSSFAVKLKVFSVVGNVVIADIFTSQDQFLNQILVEEKFCFRLPEGKLSNINHINWEVAEERGIKSEKEFSEKFSEDWTLLNENMRGTKIPMSRTKKVEIFGPSTSFQTSFTSVISIGALRRVNVDRNGINCITIKSDPNIASSVLMVAAEVGINQSGSTMLARNTTLLPSIPGLQSLLCLLFSPVIELRTNASETQYTGAICGLGSMYTRRGWVSLFPDHDVEVLFDVEVGFKDLVDVNGIRMMINIAVGGGDGIARWNQATIRKVQKTVRNKLLSFLRKARENVVPQSCRTPYRWNLIDTDRIASHDISDTSADRKDFYRLHNAVYLKKQPFQ